MQINRHVGLHCSPWPPRTGWWDDELLGLLLVTMRYNETSRAIKCRKPTICRKREKKTRSKQKVFMDVFFCVCSNRPHPDKFLWWIHHHLPCDSMAVRPGSWAGVFVTLLVARSLRTLCFVLMPTNVPWTWESWYLDVLGTFWVRTT